MKAMKWVASTLFFLMLFAPTRLKAVKISLIVIVIAAVMGSILRKRGAGLRIHRSILAWLFFFTALGLFYLFLGVVRGHPGALPNATVFVVWPLLYVLMMSGVSAEILDALLKTMVVATIAICAYAMQYLAHMFGAIPWFLDLGLGEAFSSYGFSLLPLNTLIFLVPFCVATLLTRKRDLWLYLAVGMGLVLVFLSGRRGLIVAVILSAPLSLAVRYRITRKSVFRPALYVGGVLLLVLLLTDAGDIAELFERAFDPRSSLDASIRAQQLEDLLAQWKNRPIWGSGLGADLGAARGQAMTIEAESNRWSYELQYVSLLANIGLVGISAYSAGIAWIYYQGARFLKDMAPALIGMTCFLLATATNPYLLKYDFLWVIFLPLTMINLRLLQSDRKS